MLTPLLTFYHAEWQLLRVSRLLLLLATIATVLEPLVGQAPSREARSVREEFFIIDNLLDRSKLSPDDALTEDSVQTRALAVFESFLDSPDMNARGDAILCAVNFANRLDARKGFLAKVSELGYSVELSDQTDTANVSVLFALGIVEHARGDMRAAKMWFDSTLRYEQRGYRHKSIAAAAKLRGYVQIENNEYAAAIEDLMLANRLFDEMEHGTTRKHAVGYDKETADRLDLSGALGSSIIKSGGDSTAALAYTTKAYDIILADDSLRTNWTYAYLVYMYHAKVLRAVGQNEQSARVTAEGLALCEARRDKNSIAYFRLKLAYLAVESGDLARAEETLISTLAMFDASGHLGHQAEAHSLLERVYERSDATVRKALYHAREARRVKLEIAEDTRVQSLFALQADYRRTQAEHTAVMAVAAAEKAELKQRQVTTQRTSLLLGIVCICGLLAFTIHRLERRRAHNSLLEEEVAERTAELASRTDQLQAKTHELEAKTHRLEASNQELERFAYIASHDLKTPLRNVTSFLGLIDRRMPAVARPALGEYVELAKGYAQSMHALVTDVLEFSRLNASVAEMSTAVDMRKLCADLAAQRMNPTNHAGPSIEILGAGRLQAPELFVKQLLGNLFDNGLKYNTSDSPRLTVSIAEDADYVTVRVRDNGIGIAPEYHGRVFELFQRLHNTDSYTGTGLGLASCRKIAERLGGSISLESVVGEGSTFTVVLPRCPVADTGDTVVAVEHAAASVAMQ